MPVNSRPTVVGDVVASRGWNDPSSRGLARLLRAEGVDLLSATALELRRGTPVYVDVGACMLEVQRVMATNHIRSVPVLSNGRVVGVLDLVELAELDL